MSKDRLYKNECGFIFPLDILDIWGGNNELGEDYYQYEYFCEACKSIHENSGWGDFDIEDLGLEEVV